MMRRPNIQPEDDTGDEDDFTYNGSTRVLDAVMYDKFSIDPGRHIFILIEHALMMRGYTRLQRQTILEQATRGLARNG